MTLWIDVAIIAIIAFCAWRGFKSGLVRGVFGLAALVLSLIVANIVATAYSSEFDGMLKPFIDGIVDTTLTDVMEEFDENGTNSPADTDSPGGIDALSGIGALGDIDALGDLGVDLEKFNIDAPDFAAAFATLREIGLPKSAAFRVAEDAAKTVEEEESEGLLWFLADTISDILSSSLSFVALFGIAFLLLAIIFSVIGNLIGFVFSLPGLKAVDMIAGALLGIAKGLLIVFVIASVLRYFGLFAQERIENTVLLQYLINNNPIADMLGV